MSIDYLVPLFFLISYSLAPEIEICLQYFLVKKFQTLCNVAIKYFY